jgi:Tfp pilus assembly protein PilF
MICPVGDAGPMSDPVHEAVSKAKRQAESGNPEGAVATLEAYLETDPHCIRPRLQLAKTAYDMGDRAYGDLQMEIVLDLDPDNLEALKAAVTVLSRDKKTRKQADALYARVIALEPSAEIHNEYARFLRNQFLDFKRSAEFYEKAIAAAPDRYEYHQNYAVLLLMDLKDFVKARQELEEVLRIRPDHESARRNLDLLLKRKFDARGNLKRRFLRRR